jgi:hypothetical protein
MAMAPTQVTPPVRESPTLDTVKSNVRAQYQADDLDVPAFLRKRGEA